MAWPAFETFLRAGLQPHIRAAIVQDHTASRAVAVSFEGIVARRPGVAEATKICRVALPIFSKLSQVTHPRPTFAVGFLLECTFPPRTTPPSMLNFCVGYEQVLQSARNKQAHIAHGNTTLHMTWVGSQLEARVRLDLASLVPPQQPPVHTRSFLLQFRRQVCPQTPPGINLPVLSQTQTTPPFIGFANATVPRNRTGLRRTALDHTGYKHFYKPQPKALRNNFSSRSRIRRINRINTLTNRRAPPPRGTPGAAQADEECTPTGGEPHAQSRGAGRRRARRALYRSWRRQCKQCLVNGAGSRTPVPSQLTQATPNRAKWFRQAVLWQHTVKKRYERKKRIQHYPTADHTASSIFS